jgi:hypothetical protein
MCYTGKCKYEDHMGDCTIHGDSGGYWPEDASCVQNDILIEKLEAEKKDNNIK